MVWKRNEPEEETPKPAGTAATPSSAQRGSAATASPRRTAGAGAPSVIGPSLTVEGDVTGEEDLTVDGTVEGRIELPQNGVVVGKSGRVKADVHARSARVQGKVTGDLFGSTEVVIEAGGEVHGNIQAPRVVLEDGCKFKGSIDMEPEDHKRRAAGGGGGGGGEGGGRRGGGGGQQGGGASARPQPGGAGSPPSGGTSAKPRAAGGPGKSPTGEKSGGGSGPGEGGDAKDG